MTDRARLVLTIADQRARDLESNAIAPDHLLFALAAEGNSVASSALRSLCAESAFIQDAFATGRIATIEHTKTRLPLDEAVERIIAESVAETNRLQHNYVGPEHLIVALSVIAPALFGQIGTEPDAIRDEVYSILGHNL